MKEEQLTPEFSPKQSKENIIPALELEGRTSVVAKPRASPKRALLTPGDEGGEAGRATPKRARLEYGLDGVAAATGLISLSLGRSASELRSLPQGRSSVQGPPQLPRRQALQNAPAPQAALALSDNKGPAPDLQLHARRWGWDPALLELALSFGAHPSSRHTGRRRREASETSHGLLFVAGA